MHSPHRSHIHPCVHTFTGKVVAEDELPGEDEEKHPVARQWCVAFHRAFNITGMQPAMLVPQASVNDEESVRGSAGVVRREGVCSGECRKNICGMAGGWRGIARTCASVPLT